MAMTPINVAREAASFLQNRRADDRNASFDYCFNVFQRAHRAGNLDGLLSPDRVEGTCLSLAFYLASWGMFRGSSKLLQRSAHAFIPVIETLVGLDHEAWSLDACVLGDRWELVDEVRESLKTTLAPIATPTDTLVTKIMLGTLGCTPAFDTFVMRVLECTSFGPKSARKVQDFSERHEAAIDAHRVPTIEFVGGGPTEVRYSKSKVIDMVLFEAGQRS